MASQPRYKPDGKRYIIAGLQVMLDNLQQDLRIKDQVTLELDTEEEHRKTLELCEEPFSAEELRDFVEQSKDVSIRELGHIQKRIDEVKALKEAFETSDIPSKEVIRNTYAAFRSSLLFEVLQLCFMNQRETIFAVGIQGLNAGKEKSDEIERLGATIQAYAEALFIGFNLGPFAWPEFPFDTP